jgi:hypothetical protein
MNIANYIADIPPPEHFLPQQYTEWYDYVKDVLWAALVVNEKWDRRWVPYATSCTETGESTGAHYWLTIFRRVRALVGH